MPDRSQFYPNAAPLFDFNSELSYDYSNNTFNPKISLRSYCCSSASSSPPSSVSKPNFVYKPQHHHYNPHSGRSLSRSLSRSSSTGTKNTASSSSFQELAFAAATVASSHQNGSLSHHRAAAAAADSGTVSPANLSDSETSNVSSPIPGTPLSSQTSISSMNNSSTSINVINSNNNVINSLSSNNIAAAGDSKKKKRCNLPKKTTKILIDWLNENLNNPYPNSKEKFELIVKTGLTNQQLSNWFINARRRKINNLRESNKVSSSSPVSQPR